MEGNLFASFSGIFELLNSTTFWWLVTIVIVAILTYFINRKGNPYL